MKKASQIPDLGERGTQLYAELTGEYDFAPQELSLLVEICRTADTLDELSALVESHGTTIANRPHPALSELRQQRLTYARLVSALRLPDADEEQTQKRAGVRGTYSM